MFSIGSPTEDAAHDLKQTIAELQQQVSILLEDQTITNAKCDKVKQENASLLSEILSLEEQIKEMETTTEKSVRRELKESQELKARYKKKLKEEVDEHADSLKDLQNDCEQHIDEMVNLKSEAKKLTEENGRLTEQLAESSKELQCVWKQHREVQEFVCREKEEFEAERESISRSLEEVTFELEKHRQNSQDPRVRSRSLLELPAQYKELQQELRKARDETRRFQEASEELQTRFLGSNLQEGRLLLLVSDNASIAEEFDKLTEIEIADALHEQKEMNRKLQIYIDGILLSIMENDPQLLEVK